MAQSKVIINPDWVVLVWVTRGIEYFFLSFKITEMDRHSRFDQFLNAMGLEMICKGYLLAVHRAEWEGLVENKARKEINKLAIKWGHDIKKLIKKIKGKIGKEKIQPFLEKEFRGFAQKGEFRQKNKNHAKTVLSGIEAAYFESRYPVPQSFYKDREFQLRGVENAYFDPLCSSDIHRFCCEFCRVIFIDLKENSGLGIPRSWFNQKMIGDKGRRFANLLFDGRKKDFLSTKLKPSLK